MLTSGEASDARLWDLHASPPKSIELLPRSRNVGGVPVYSTDRERRLLALVGADRDRPNLGSEFRYKATDTAAHAREAP